MVSVKNSKSIYLKAKKIRVDNDKIVDSETEEQIDILKLLKDVFGNEVFDLSASVKIEDNDSSIDE